MKELELDYIFGDVMKELEGITIISDKKVEPALIIEHRDDKTILKQLREHTDRMYDQISTMNTLEDQHGICLGCSRPNCNDH